MFISYIFNAAISLNFITGRENQKAWNKTREKYMSVERRQIETDRGSYYNKQDG